MQPSSQIQSSIHQRMWIPVTLVESLYIPFLYYYDRMFSSVYTCGLACEVGDLCAIGWGSQCERLTKIAASCSFIKYCCSCYLTHIPKSQCTRLGNSTITTGVVITLILNIVMQHTVPTILIPPCCWSWMPVRYIHSFFALLNAYVIKRSPTIHHISR